MTITIYILFLLYMAACIMDGPDVKPLWKRALGGKLERWADELKPVDYCNMRKCKFCQQAMEQQYNAPSIRLIAKEYIIPENEMMDAMMNEQLSNKYSFPLPQSRSVDGLIDNAKRQIVRSLLTTAKGFIDIEIHKDEISPEIYLYGSLYVGSKVKLY